MIYIPLPFIIQFMMISILWITMLLIKFKSKNNMKSLSPFECGFNTFNSSMPLSVQFSLLVFIFLLFDVELSILISSNWTIKLLNSDWILMMLSFSTSILFSLIWELTKKLITWFKYK